VTSEKKKKAGWKKLRCSQQSSAAEILGLPQAMAAQTFFGTMIVTIILRGIEQGARFN